MADTTKGSGGTIAGAVGAVALLLAGYFGWGVYQKTTDAEAVTAATEEVVAATVSTDGTGESTETASVENSDAPEVSDADDIVSGSAEEASDEGTGSGDEVASATETDTADVSDVQNADPQEDLSPPMTPVFDVVRVDPDGNTLVAGKADPGAMEVLLDGEPVGDAVVDGSGQFAAILMLEPSDTPRVMSLRATDAQDQVVLSEQSIIVEPFAAPIVVTEAVNDTTEETDDGAVVLGAEGETETADGDAAEAILADTETSQTPRTVIADEDGIRVLPGAVAPDSIRIDTVTYGSEGEVILAGQGTKAGAVLRLYVNNNPLISTEVREDYSWTSTLPDVASGLYVLRVDQIAADGSVTSRAQIPFQREAVEDVLAAQASVQETTKTVGAAVQETAPEIVVATAETADPLATNHVNVEGDEPQDTSSALVITDITSEDVIAVANAQETGEVTETVSENASVEVVQPDVSAATEDTASTTVSVETPVRPQIVTVQPGFTLWGIASETYGDGFLYVQLYEANKDQIGDPDLIYPGQIFELPE